MPELPEVESVVRAMLDADPALIGSRVESVDLCWLGIVKDIAPGDFIASVSGKMISSVTRHGKYMFFGLGGGAGCFMAMHLRMTGILHICGSSQPLNPHTRLSIALENGMSLRFDDPRKFGRVWLVDDPSRVTAELGPDALTVGAEEFACRLRSRNRQLKSLLLDQSFVAGIGNIYADESLFLAGLNPLQKSHQLGDTEIALLHRSVVAVLEEAVAVRGANIDGVFKAGGYVVKVYGRQGKPCSRCGRSIVKIRAGQRGTHFCPVCQPLL